VSRPSPAHMEPEGKATRTTTSPTVPKAF
jgi:hypothetical protein